MNQAPKIRAGEVRFSSGMADFLSDRRSGGGLDPVFLADRPHQKIGDKADDQQTGHDVQDDRISLFFGNMAGDVMVQNSIDDEWADDSGG